MQVNMLKSKIHRATVSGADLSYEGSIAIDPQLCELAELRPFEQVDIYNCNNGERFTTYVIYGKSGQICLNGAAARKVHTGDIVIICSYASYSETEAMKHIPKLVRVNAQNKSIEVHHSFEPSI
ncbi:MAG: aspartate 1-decarboxylase [Bdellovibrionales bacterium RBG_16_40_8]|nr:MAG: aspartate 1-decarboxylase [Bdellovibrionales bacterium RBG_16_40_8]